MDKHIRYGFMWTHPIYDEISSADRQLVSLMSVRGVPLGWGMTCWRDIPTQDVVYLFETKEKGLQLPDGVLELAKCTYDELVEVLP